MWTRERGVGARREREAREHLVKAEGAKVVDAVALGGAVRDELRAARGAAHVAHALVLSLSVYLFCQT